MSTSRYRPPITNSPSPLLSFPPHPNQQQQQQQSFANGPQHHHRTPPIGPLSSSHPNSHSMATVTIASAPSPVQASTTSYIFNDRTNADDDDDSKSRGRKGKNKKHWFIRACLMTPLFFITLLYAFAAYAYFFSLVVDYLWFERRLFFKAFVYGLVFLWFELNALIAVWHCWYRGGGNITSEAAASVNPDDEEARIENHHPRWNHKHHPHPQDHEESQSLLLQSDQPSSSSLLKHHLPTMSRSNEPPSVVMTTAMRELARSVNSSPTIPSNANPSPAPHSVQVKSDGTQRWCRKCRVAKPDRAHHCSSCGTCVLKMDHHCPWLGGGCVGWANYKFFLIFLNYSGFLGCWVASTTMIELIHFVGMDDNNFELAPVIWAIVFFVGLVFGSSVGLFGLYHLYLACQNKTTIETMEKPPSIVPTHERPAHYQAHDYALSREERRQLEKAQSKLNIYDLGGRKRNLKQVFGEDWRYWFIPFGSPPGDGHTFPINQEQLHRLREITTTIRTGNTTHRAMQVRDTTSSEFADDEGERDDDDDVEGGLGVAPLNDGEEELASSRFANGYTGNGSR